MTTTTAGPDGYLRSTTDDAKLNKLFASVFRGPDGEALIQHLRAITIEAVAGPEITNDQLRHLEGMRYLVAIMQRRINSGRENE